MFLTVPIRHVFQRGDATAEQAAFVIKEWIPKLVKSLLARKYDWNRTTYTTVVTFFGKLTVFLTENLGGDNEVLIVIYDK